MTCKSAQELILELGPLNPEVVGHVAGCQACQYFLSLQRSLDEELAEAYTAPVLDPAFRFVIRAKIRTAQRRQWLDALPALIAPVAGLITSGAWRCLKWPRFCLRWDSA